MLSLIMLLVWRTAVQATFINVTCSVAAGIIWTLLVGSLGEWFVHRYAMHRGKRFPLFRLATELHHRAHHWVLFTPDRYIYSGPIQYPSVMGRGTDEICRTRCS